MKTIPYLMHPTTHNGICTTMIEIDDAANGVVCLVCNINKCRYTIDTELDPPQCRARKIGTPTKGHEQRGANAVCKATFFTVFDTHQVIDSTPLSTGIYRTEHTLATFPSWQHFLF
ncbi:unnamed protein product, partial [Ectocarpus sp. 8 AP-2014]